jgi:hypothetical protein
LLLFLPLLKREDDVNALQTNAHSGAMPKSFSSSESSQLHGGAGLDVLFACDASEGTNAKGEIKCLMSVIGIYFVYYNARIIIRIALQCLCFYS